MKLSSYPPILWRKVNGSLPVVQWKVVSIERGQEVDLQSIYSIQFLRRRSTYKNYLEVDLQAHLPEYIRETRKRKEEKAGISDPRGKEASHLILYLNLTIANYSEGIRA